MYLSADTEGQEGREGEKGGGAGGIGRKGGRQRYIGMDRSLKGVYRGACQVSNDDGIISLMRTRCRPHTLPTFLSVNNQIRKCPVVSLASASHWS